MLNSWTIRWPAVLRNAVQKLLNMERDTFHTMRAYLQLHNVLVSIGTRVISLHTCLWG